MVVVDKGIIQPVWEIDEYVSISLMDVWFSPPRAPRRPDASVNMVTSSFILKYAISVKGAIFCQVRITRA